MNELSPIPNENMNHTQTPKSMSTPITDMYIKPPTLRSPLKLRYPDQSQQMVKGVT